MKKQGVKILVNGTLRYWGKSTISYSDIVMLSGLNHLHRNEVSWKSEYAEGTLYPTQRVTPMNGMSFEAETDGDYEHDSQRDIDDQLASERMNRD